MMNPQQEEILAQALNAPLYKSRWHTPAYALDEVGDWRLAHCPFHLEHGYVTRLWAVSGMPLLMRHAANTNSWEVWMSLTPHEIESQELACEHARGHTVVMGLGMGWVAANIVLNPAVEKVTIVERDPQVIALLDRSGALDGLGPEARAKLRIVQADALEWRPDDAVDFLYVDIWRDLDEPQVMDQMQQIQTNVNAHCIYFWGQEIKLFGLLDGQREALRNAPTHVLRKHVEALAALPLLVPDSGDYASTIEAVIAVRRERGIRAR